MISLMESNYVNPMKFVHLAAVLVDLTKLTHLQFKQTLTK